MMVVSRVILRRQRLLRFLAGACVWACAVWPVTAGESRPVADKGAVQATGAPAGGGVIVPGKPLLDRSAVLKAAAAITRERYPDADTVLVDDHVRVRYRADGTYETLDDWYVKVLTEKGRRSRRVLSIYFTIPYSLREDVRVPLLEVIKPGGESVKVDVARQARVMINRGQMYANIYNPNSKVLRVSVPGVEVGDVLHYLVYRRERHPRVKGTWCDLQLFEGTSPIRHYVYEVFGPKQLPLRHMLLKDEVAGTVVHATGEKHGLLHYRWEASRVPRMFPEPRMPARSRVVARLLLSTAPDWKTISRWYWSVSAPHYRVTPAIKAKVAQLVKGKTDRRKRIRAIFDFVSKRVRYLGITTEKTAPGYEPHDVGETFAALAGVCRDKAALLVAMLREAGFKAYPVLINAGDKLDADVPLPWFNHAISCVQEPGGAYLLMDATDENARRLLPAYLSDKSYLVARPEGEPLATTPVMPVNENLMRINTRARLDAAGGLRGTSDLAFDGVNDNGYRGWFARIKPAERRRYFESVLHAVVPGATLTAFTLEPRDMQDTSKPLRARLAFKADEVVIGKRETRLLPLPLFGRRIGFTSFMLSGMGLEKRKYPYRTGVTCGVEEKLELTLAPAAGKVVSLPHYKRVEADVFSWGLDLACKQDKLIGHGRFLLNSVQYSPAQYLRLKALLRTMEYDLRKMVVLGGVAGGAFPGADAVTLSEKINYDIADQHAWVETREVKRRILTYAGKKRYGEIKIDYNPAWEEVDVLAAEVTTPAGKVLQADASAINRMDARWVGAAPRYPAGKTLVVGLPAVDIGCVVYYRLLRRCRGKPFFSAREYFQGFDPVLDKAVSIKVPASLHLRTLVLNARGNAAAPMVTEQRRRAPGGARVYEWHARNMLPLKRERHLPPLYSFAPTLMASTGDWRGYARRVIGILARNAARQGACAARARKLAGTLRRARDRVRAVRDFVARQVREAGPGLHQLPLANLSPADTTLRQGYGNGADRACVLYSMLAALRLRPRFVLVSRSPRVASMQEPLRAIPDLSLLDTVLVRLRLGGEDVYLGDTDQYAPLGLSPHAGCLALSPAGRLEPLLIPETYREREVVRLRVDLEADGGASITRTRILYGMLHAARNRLFSQLTPELRRRRFQAMVAGFSQSARPVGELKTDFATYPGSEEFKVSWDHFAVLDGRRMYFDLPEAFTGLLRLWSSSRSNPYYAPRPRRLRIEITLLAPPGFSRVALAPVPFSWRGPAGLGEVRVVTARPKREDDGRSAMVVTYDADLRPALVPARDYGKLRMAKERLDHRASRTVMFSR